MALMEKVDSVQEQMGNGSGERKLDEKNLKETISKGIKNTETEVKIASDEMIRGPAAVKGRLKLLTEDLSVGTS